MGKEKGRIRELFLDLVFDIVGGFLQAIGLHCFIDSINIAPGGATGMAILINRLTGLFDQYVYPVAWYMASGDTALGVSELGRPLESDDPNVTYFEVTRFSELWKMKCATEQVFTREYAERVLYPYLTEEKEDFIEYDGKLYRNTSIIGSGWYTDTDRMEVLHKDQTSAEIEVDFRYIDEVTTDTVTMQKENGLWKIASLPNHLAPTPGRQ